MVKDDRPPSAHLLERIEYINQVAADASVIAIDIPIGLLDKAPRKLMQEHGKLFSFASPRSHRASSRGVAVRSRPGEHPSAERQPPRGRRHSRGVRSCRRPTMTINRLDAMHCRTTTAHADLSALQKRQVSGRLDLRVTGRASARVLGGLFRELRPPS